MARYEVKCVDIHDNSTHNDCRCIEYIGLPGENTRIVKKTPAEVYDMVEIQGDTVIVKHRSKRTTVHGVKMDDGTEYVRTDPNDTPNDNLLKQDSCPV